MGERIGIYLRISEDKDGEQQATSRQRADCLRHAKRRGWTVVDTYEDVDTSAYKQGVKRPEFERMLRAVKDRHLDGVLAWKMDRISRRQRDLVRLDEECEKAGGFISTVVENIDTREPSGRFVAELLVSQARMESENMRIRIERKHAEMAREGRPMTGGSRPFGYTVDRMTIIPDEAVIIREARDRVFAGEGLRGICNDWKRRGIVTSTGKPWQQHPLRRMLCSSLLSGQREHNGTVTNGTWPAILTPGETKRLRAILQDPSRLKRVSARRYVLTGFLKCGVCGEALVARPRKDGVRRYVCGKQPSNNNCGKIARVAEPVEEVVRESICIALDGVDLRKYMKATNGHDADELAAAIRADEDALREWAVDLAEKRITRGEYYAARDVIDARLKANQHKLSRTNGAGILHQIAGAGDAVRAQWADKGLDWQRALIGAVVDHIVLEPAVKGRNTFDPTLVRIVWRF